MGKHVLVPFGDIGEYDLAVDDDGKMSRIQCKTGRLVRGVVRFKTVSYGRGMSKGMPYYSKSYDGKADTFAVWCRDTNCVYVVPVAGAPKGSCDLRVAESKKMGRSPKEIRWAKDFLL